MQRDCLVNTVFDSSTGKQQGSKEALVTSWPRVSPANVNIRVKLCKTLPLLSCGDNLNLLSGGNN